MTNYQLYQHYRTQKYYRIINEIHDDETGEIHISYQCVNDQNAKIWFQPKDRFFGLTKDGKRRFTPFSPKNIKNEKLYNCVSDRLVDLIECEDFGNYSEHDIHDIFAFDGSIDDIFAISVYIAFLIKQKLSQDTTISEDILERKEKGFKTYGCYLTPFNGRNAIEDAYEECLDLLNYLLQNLMESE